MIIRTDLTEAEIHDLQVLNKKFRQMLEKQSEKAKRQEQDIERLEAENISLKALKAEHEAVIELLAKKTAELSQRVIMREEVLDEKEKTINELEKKIEKMGEQIENLKYFYYGNPRI